MNEYGLTKAIEYLNQRCTDLNRMAEEAQQQGREAEAQEYRIKYSVTEDIWAALHLLGNKEPPCYYCGGEEGYHAPGCQA